MNIEPIYDKRNNYSNCINDESKVTRGKVCAVTGELYTVDVKLQSVLDWLSGSLIQNVMPELTLEQREFLISGLTPDEFKVLHEQE